MRALKIAVAVLIGLVVIGILIDDGEEGESVPAAEARAAVTEEEVAVAPVDRLSALVEAELSGSDRVQEVQYFEMTGRINVRWSLNDQLTSGLIRAAAQRDAIDILRTIDAAGVPYETVFIRGTFSLADQYGNASESPVLSLEFDRATIDRINWSNMLPDNIFGLATSSTIHPALQ